MRDKFFFDREYKLVGENDLDIQIIEEDSILPTLFYEEYGDNITTQKTNE